MSLLKNRSVLLFKAEVTYRTDPVPTAAANAVLVENLSVKPANARMYQRMPVRTAFAKLKPIYAGHLMEISFDVEVKGSGAAGTAPEIGPLLRACGFGETISAGVSVTYKPASASIISGTFYAFHDGKRHIITGARCTALAGVINVGEAMKLSMTFVGHHVSETDVALATPTYSSVVPPVVLSGGFSWDSYSGIFTKLDFDMGLATAIPADINQADGYGEIQITGRNLTGKLDLEDVLVATYDFLTKWKNSTAMNFTTGVIGTAGNRWQLSMPAATITEQMPAEKDGGILVRELSFQAAESSGDDELSLAFS